MSAYFAGAAGLFFMSGLRVSAQSLGECLFVILTIFLIQAAAGFIFSSIAHSFLDMSGHSGTAAGLFVLFGISDLAWTLLVPLAIYNSLLPASAGLSAVFFIAVSAVNIYLKTEFIKHMYGVGRFTAFFAVTIPYLLTAGICMSVVLFGILWLALLVV